MDIVGPVGVQVVDGGMAGVPLRSVPAQVVVCGYVGEEDTWSAIGLERKEIVKSLLYLFINVIRTQEKS